MVVHHSLAQFSDLTFSTSFVIYFIGLILSIMYLILNVSVAEAAHGKRAPRKEAVLVGGEHTTTEPGAAPEDIASELGDAPHPIDSQRLAKKQALATRFAGMTQAIVWLAIALNLVSVVLRGLSAQRVPFGNLYEYVSIISCGTMILVSIVVATKKVPTLWPWALVPVIVLMFFGGTKLYASAGPVMPALQSMWFPIHVSTVVTGACIALVSGLTSLIFLVRTAADKRQPTGKLGLVLRTLPDAQLLDSIAYKTAIWALPIFGLGIAFGAMWAESAWGRFWSWDPKEVMSYVTWIILAAYLHARATPTWKRTHAAWINVAAFAAMVFNLFFVNLVVSGLHSYAGLN